MKWPPVHNDIPTESPLDSFIKYSNGNPISIPKLISPKAKCSGCPSLEALPNPGVLAILAASPTID